MKSVNCGYRNHDFKPTGKIEIINDSIYNIHKAVITEFECSKCGISTSWEVTK